MRLDVLRNDEGARRRRRHSPQPFPLRLLGASGARLAVCGLVFALQRVAVTSAAGCEQIGRRLPGHHTRRDRVRVLFLSVADLPGAPFDPRAASRRR